MEDASLTVGDWRRPVAAPALVTALAATLSYRLEPRGRGSRFPVLVYELFAGRLEPEHAPAALGELSQAAAELGELPAERVVQTLEGLERFDPVGQPVAAGAATVRELLAARDGRPIVQLLEEGIEECLRRSEPLRLETAEVRSDTRRGLLGFLLGFLGMAIALFFFPDFRVQFPVGANHSSRTAGLPLWSLGLAVAGAGLFELAVARSPALAAALRKSRSLSLIVYCGWYLIAIAIGIYWSVQR